MDIIAEGKAFRSLMKFKSLALMHFGVDDCCRHIDIGHNKPYHLRIMGRVADEFPGAKFAYFDNSAPESGDINGENINSVKDVRAQWFAGLYGISPGRVTKRNLALPKNLTITKNPRGPFNSATYLWTLHEFEDQARESLSQVYSLLTPGGRLGIIDYSMGFLRGMSALQQEKIIKKLFDSGNERAVLEQEGLDTCVRMHSQYTPESLMALVASAGFIPVAGAQEIEYRGIGKGMKAPKLFMGFWKK